jgi:hypothetical protein
MTEKNKAEKPEKADAVAAVAIESRSALVEVTGASSEDEARGLVQAWKGNAERMPALEKQVADLTAALEKRDRDELLARNARKLNAKLREWAAAQPLATLRAFLDAAPDLAVVNAPLSVSPGPALPADAQGNALRVVDGKVADGPLAGKGWWDLAPAAKHNLRFNDRAAYDALFAARGPAPRA